uniref:Phosphatidylcholine transfer protein n=1 Tax=Globisporangium ultimum (strain ATCC 200006 / CBS 805.95 / DAOM BR144) TaxID=431595 RepID=K3X082_GLOUD
MSSFTLRPTSPPGSTDAVAQQRPKLLQRTSDPQFSEHDLNDAVDMGEHVRWANVGEPIYAEKDLEIFRVSQRQCTLPVYYVKAWLPYAADTVFNALFDARFRREWDAKNVNQVYVVERRTDGDVMYFAQKLPWPFADRDYVFHRRAKFFAEQQSFVVVCQSMHHNNAPQCNGFVRVETYALRMCIRSTGTSSCDVYVEYEDDTNFSVPNYAVNLLLAVNVPSFMHKLRTACENYAKFIQTLDDASVESIPSQVMRWKSEEELEMLANVSSISSAVSSPSIVHSSNKPTTSVFGPKRHKLSRRLKRSTQSQSDDAGGASDSSSISELHSRRRLRELLLDRSKSNSAREPNSQRKAKENKGKLFSRSSSSPVSGGSEELDDDFVIQFHKQRIGLHLETDLFSNKVLVAFCEKDSEAAKASVCIEPGFLVTSVNGMCVADMNFSEILHEVKQAARPLALGFTHPDKERSNMYRRFKEPKNVLKCLISRDDQDLVRSLRPLDEDTCMSAVLKADLLAPAYGKKKRGVTSSHLSPSGTSNVDVVTVPEGYLVYEIDDCYVLDLPFAEIAHLLRRNSEPRAVAFKAALAVEGDRVAQRAARSALSKRLSDVFKWRSYSFDTDSTTSTTSRSSSGNGFNRRLEDLQQDATRNNELERDQQKETPKSTASTAQSIHSYAGADANGQDIKWGDASPGCCLSDYTGVVITSENLTWAWQHVHLLKADERIFSAALLIEKLEAYLMVTEGSSCPNATTIQTAMDKERNLLTKIKERSAQGMQAMREFNSENESDWQFGQTYFGVSTHWKPGENGTVWLKLDGLVEGVDIFNTIAVIRETDLYSVWTPFCNRSQLLQQNGHVDIITYLSVAFPLLQRDAIIQAFGINACYESRAILLLGKTEHETNLPVSIKVPKVKGWNADRMEMRGFRALIEPITRTKARTCIVANIDPKCPIPRSLLNFGIKKMAGMLLYLIRKEAEKIEQAQRDHTENEHLRRIESDPTQFYQWLRPLMEKWFEDLRCDLLPPPLPLSSDAVTMTTTRPKELSDAGNKNPRPSRTTAFYHHQTLAQQLQEQESEHERLQQCGLSHRVWIDYLYDFGIWPYLLLFMLAQVTPEMAFLHVCLLKFIFTCTCTWFGIPGAFSWQTRQMKRVQNELDPLRQRCVVLAALLDVFNSWFIRIWANWIVCYLPLLLEHSIALANSFQQQEQQADVNQLCFSRTPLQVRESENFWLVSSAFVFATIVVAVQIVVSI